MVKRKNSIIIFAIICVFVCAVFSLIFMGSSANASLADTKANDLVATNDDPIAKIGSKEYTTLQAAFNEVKAGETILLLKDKITVKDYGSDSYGKYTEMSVEDPMGEEIGTAMPDDALANVVLRRESGNPNTPNTLINSYNGNTPPSGYITIQGLETGTQLGSLDFSGADYIKIKNLTFDVTTPVRAFSHYGYKTGEGEAQGVYDIKFNKDKVTTATKISHKQNDYLANIIDCNYSGGNTTSPDTSGSAAIGIEISYCNFVGTTEEYGAGSCCISASSSGSSNHRQMDWTIDHCNFNCTCSKALNIGYFNNNIVANKNTITFTNNTCGAKDMGFADDALDCGTGCSGKFNISNNVFTNWCLNKTSAWGGGAIWIVHQEQSSNCNFTIKDNEFNFDYVDYEPYDLYYVSTIRLRCEKVPDTGTLTLNGVVYDPNNQKPFLDALTSASANNLHPGYGESGTYLWGTGFRWQYITQVDFDADGGTPEPDTEYVINNSKIAKPATDPTKQGVNFAYWYVDDPLEPFDFDNTLITEPTTLTALYADYTVTVTFDSSGGTYVEPITVNAGSTVDKPTDPTKEKYDFVVWMYEDTVFDFTTPLFLDITLTAAWETETGQVIVVEPDVPVDPETGEQKVVIEDEAKEQALENAEQIVADSLSGKDVPGLTEEENEQLRETLNSVGANEKSVTILVPKVEDYYTEIPEEEQEIVAAASLPNSTVVCSYDFTMDIVVKVVDIDTGEEIEGKSFTGSLTSIDEAVDYKIRLTLPEETYEECAIQVLKVHEGVVSDITDLCDIDRVNHYVDVPAYEFSTYLINTSESLYLTFDSQGGSAVEKQEVAYNTCPKKPADPTRSGFTFEGWYEEPECTTAFDFSKPLTEQKTVYAKWKENGGGGDVPGGGGGTGGSGGSGSGSSGSASTGDSLMFIVIGIIAVLAIAIVVDYIAWRRKRKTFLE